MPVQKTILLTIASPFSQSTFRNPLGHENRCHRVTGRLASPPLEARRAIEEVDLVETLGRMELEQLVAQLGVHVPTVDQGRVLRLVLLLVKVITYFRGSGCVPASIQICQSRCFCRNAK